jgi:SAM-dependent methyltransferase
MDVLFDSAARELAACPVCKTGLDGPDVLLECHSCGHRFPRTSHGEVDLRINYAGLAMGKLHAAWADGQKGFEASDGAWWPSQSVDRFSAEIDSVREIYQAEFRLSGVVIDVGGAWGTLRHYLPQDATYMSVDPFSGLFDRLENEFDLLLAYPCLSEPCRFILGLGEHLPVRSRVADWVHLRSVLDHLEDPLMALWESCRVLKPGGSALVGVTVSDGSAGEARVGTTAHEPVHAKPAIRPSVHCARAIAHAAYDRTRRRPRPSDHHMWHPTSADVLNLIREAGLSVEKVHWQKPPYTSTMYVKAVRPQ